MTHMKNSKTVDPHWLKRLTNLDYSAAHMATLWVSMVLGPVPQTESVHNGYQSSSFYRR